MTRQYLHNAPWAKIRAQLTAMASAAGRRRDTEATYIASVAGKPADATADIQRRVRRLLRAGRYDESD